MGYFKVLLSIILSGLIYPGLSQDRNLKTMLEEEKAGKSDTIHVNLLNNICDSLYRKKPAETIIYGDKALKLSIELDYRKGEAYALKFIGMGYYIQGDYVKAIDYFGRAKDVFEAINYRKGVANMLNSIGVIYNNGGDDIKATDYFLKSQHIGHEKQEVVFLLGLGNSESKLRPRSAVASTLLLSGSAERSRCVIGLIEHILQRIY